MTTTFFLMIISGRSGSSYLRALINQDERILMLGEMLARKDNIQQQKTVKDFFEGQVGDNNYLNQKAVLGFKTKLNDIQNLPDFLTLINSYNPQVIINRRQNYLRQAISRERMLVLLSQTKEKYGVGHHSPRSRDDIVSPIKVDVDSVYRFTREFEARDKLIADFAEKLNRKPITLYYEDFAVNPKLAIDNLSEILGLKINVENYNITYKNTANDLREAISNYDELTKRFQDTKYFSLLQNI